MTGPVAVWPKSGAEFAMSGPPFAWTRCVRLQAGALGLQSCQVRSADGERELPAGVPVLALDLRGGGLGERVALALGDPDPAVGHPADDPGQDLTRLLASARERDVELERGTIGDGDDPVLGAPQLDRPGQ